MKRNPDGALGGIQKNWLQGMDIVDVVSAGGGLIAVTQIPGMIVKPTAEGAELDSGQKLMKLLASVGVAIGAGVVGRQFASAQAGKAALAGGLAGAGVQALTMFTGFKLSEQGPRRLNPALRPALRSGRISRYPTPPREAEFEGARLR